MKNILSAIFLIILILPSVFAGNLVTTQMGYHPDSSKRAVLYNEQASNVAIVSSASNQAVATFPLGKATNYEGQIVECQGNLPCLAADISSFNTPGRYYLKTNTGVSSEPFTISPTIYDENIPVLLDFFNAMMQQGSAYHQDLHASMKPSFSAMADGSFLMEADQASLALIRLSNAYRENPSLLSADRYNIISAGKPDTAEYITNYAKYLLSLQGIVLQERTDGSGFRTGTGMRIVEAFTPASAAQSTATVYYSNTGGASQTVPLRSLCGPNTGTTAYNQCINNARDNYKCVVGETCLNLAYDGKTGVITGRQGYAISTGWSYEFQCYPDINTGSAVFGTEQDRCMIFRPETSALQTSRALHALASSIPAVNAVDQNLAKRIAARAVNTYNYMKANSQVGDAGHLGSALFILYDITGDLSYLRDAHSLRTQVATDLVSDPTRGNEFYWEEYVRHKQALTQNGLAYVYLTIPPEEFFRGKMYFDYKDKFVGISDAGERVYDFIPGSGDFQESRPILIEGVIAAKTLALYPSPEPFISEIADSQLAWITGMNKVQDGVPGSSPLASYSFIFGIGTNPRSQHTRLALNSGYRQATGGAIAGARSSQFFFSNPDQPGSYVEYDGFSDILGQRFGSMGNKWRGELYNDPMKPITYKNGKASINGWIDGAYDADDTDVILNFEDSTGSWRFTESTNEIVATAVELFSYLDAKRTGTTRAPTPTWTLTDLKATNDGLSQEFIHGAAQQPVCGNQVVESPEQCDDGNTANGDGCSSACTTETAPPQPPPQGCTIQSAAVQCIGGTKTIDTNLGSCRQLECRNGQSYQSVQACEKSPGFFEMYNQGRSGSVDVCIGNTCLGGWGFKTGTYQCQAPSPVCGNGVKEGTEQCDDGNTANGDGCSSTCTTETIPPQPPAQGCTIQSAAVQCITGIKTIDNNLGSCRQLECRNGLSYQMVQACEKSPGFFEMYNQGRSGNVDICIGNTCLGGWGFRSGTFSCQAPSPVCGNGVKEGTEQCDDGNTANGDGCSSTCTIETPLPQTCGNGVKEGTEQCDDSNMVNGDGCSSSCALEPAGKLTVAPWYPKGRDYVFVCSLPQGSYLWNFGDGHIQESLADNVYHTYASSGAYDVTCRSGSIQATLHINVQ